MTEDTRKHTQEHMDCNATIVKPKPVRLKFFVAGTDTEVGKTLVSTALLCAAQQAGLSTLGLKPIAAGAEMTEEGLRNEDALSLMSYSSQKLSYAQVNPVCLREAIAPHIAAQREKRILRMESILGFCRGALMGKTEFSIVEGAGGWRVPLNNSETMADLAKNLKMPIILVVGMKLGCLNHALLTVEAMQRDGVDIAGWVATHLQADMPVLRENIETLEKRMPCPLLFEIPFLNITSAEYAAKYVDINKLMEVARS